MADVLEHTFQFPIPRNGADSVVELPNNIKIMVPGGLLIPDVQDVVFLRNSSGDGDQRKDIMVTWQVDIRAGLSPVLKARGIALQDEITGPEEECGPNKPVEEMVDGVTKLVGGFALERTWRALNLEGAPRAYPLSTSVQVPKGGMHAPALGNKFYGTEDDALSLHMKLIQFLGEVSMLELKEGPPGLADLLKNQGDMMNTPYVDTTGGANADETVVQSNEDDTPTTITDIGVLGGPHIDKGDEEAGVTAATSLSKLEPGIFPGVIVVLKLGIALVLAPLVTSYFCGVRPHGGTTPTYNSYLTALTRKDNMLALGVAYGTVASLGGIGICPFAALPENKVLAIGPELHSVRSHLPENTSWAEQSTYAGDGASLMQPSDHTTWVAREALLLALSIAQQLPHGVHIDTAKFLSSWSWDTGEGKRQNVGPWELGPGYAEGGFSFDQGEGSESAPYGNVKRQQHATAWRSTRRTSATLYLWSISCARSMLMVIFTKEDQQDNTVDCVVFTVAFGVEVAQGRLPDDLNWQHSAQIPPNDGRQINPIKTDTFNAMCRIWMECVWEANAPQTTVEQQPPTSAPGGELCLYSRQIAPSVGRHILMPLAGQISGFLCPAQVISCDLQELSPKIGMEWCSQEFLCLPKTGAPLVPSGLFTCTFDEWKQTANQTLQPSQRSSTGPENTADALFDHLESVFPTIVLALEGTVVPDSDTGLMSIMEDAAADPVAFLQQVQTSYPIEVLAERLTRAAKLPPHLVDTADKLEKLSDGSITVYLLGSTMLWSLAIAFLTATDSASGYRAIRENRVRWPRMEIQLIWAAYQEVCELPVNCDPHPTLQIVVPGISIPDLQVRPSKS
ncbi:hypothetical protein C8F04DRAFT_1192716 [Mycena alexandri]|uniref:Uncharacterized protein n=1 Tax=Mycena alexandri TaxID=1745969 RepID=A0AAD6SAE3_9AGAR|nr:hypothetical protein C8F04DRAFT_1192716 [Mycena alexandri]